VNTTAATGGMYDSTAMMASLARYYTLLIVKQDDATVVLRHPKPLPIAMSSKSSSNTFASILRVTRDV
jgi:hypothetical protein